MASRERESKSNFDSIPQLGAQKPSIGQHKVLTLSEVRNLEATQKNLY